MFKNVISLILLFHLSLLIIKAQQLIVVTDGEIQVNRLSGHNNAVDWNPGCLVEKQQVDKNFFNFNTLRNLPYYYFTYMTVEQTSGPQTNKFRATYCTDNDNYNYSCSPPETFGGSNIPACFNSGGSSSSNPVQVSGISHPSNYDFSLTYEVCSDCTNCDDNTSGTSIQWWQDTIVKFANSFFGGIFLEASSDQLDPISCNSTLACDNWPNPFNSCN